MRIDEFDEFQGVNSEMVREWMERTGWVCRTDERGDKRWFCGTGRSGILDARITIKDGLLWIAMQGDQSLQSLLREINPRMRKGMPSNAALAAHDHWLVRDTETRELELHRVADGHLYSMSVYRGCVRTTDAKELPDFGTWMEFWPCDEHGNKLRWPTDANGAML